eukprot:CAMPEP_0175463166 /NCGR_PEP_ID=MMETSP0095-20121207/69060_1 /TAXON_ID=311494 /ORGANISM="Alexandrium monilatum, Strain CCMP3105" /LENGTH=74 /DNA_ID=CAMNT_0016764291 /DNA_START=16 /DNA_END=237 /DNA_ORIENTATION=-
MEAFLAPTAADPTLVHSAGALRGAPPPGVAAAQRPHVQSPTSPAAEAAAELAPAAGSSRGLAFAVAGGLAALAA